MWPFTRGRGRLERILGRILLANMEARTSLENPQISLADPNAWAALFGAWHSASGIEVTLQRALGVPAVWCAVNFIADTFAALPAPVYRKSADGKREKLGDDDAIHSLLNIPQGLPEPAGEALTNASPNTITAIVLMTSSAMVMLSLDPQGERWAKAALVLKGAKPVESVETDSLASASP